MKIYAIIPSRYGSSRFPGKPLAIIAGKPLIAWVVEQVVKAPGIDEVIVATDDERIADAVSKTGLCNAVMTPSELPSGTDRVACALKNRLGRDFDDDDIILNVQGDEPLVDPELIGCLAAKLASDTKWAMATAATPIKSDAEFNDKNVVKVVLDEDDGALYFSRSPIPLNRDNGGMTKDLCLRHLGIYAYRGAFLKLFTAAKPCPLELCEKLEQLRALWMGQKIAVVRTIDEGIGVDTKEDAERVAAILSSRK